MVPSRSQTAKYGRSNFQHHMNLEIFSNRKECSTAAPPQFWIYNIQQVRIVLPSILDPAHVAAKYTKWGRELSNIQVPSKTYRVRGDQGSYFLFRQKVQLGPSSLILSPPPPSQALRSRAVNAKRHSSTRCLSSKARSRWKLRLIIIIPYNQKKKNIPRENTSSLCHNLVSQ